MRGMAFGRFRRAPKCARPSEPPTRWSVESWSNELGRGSVRSDSGVVLPFDASATTVAHLVVGEGVNVGLVDRGNGPHVASVELHEAPRVAAPRADVEITVEPSGLLALRPIGDELQRLEALVFDRFDLLDLVDFKSRLVVDAGPELRALLEAELGRPIEPVLRVQAAYPFDWQGISDLDRLFGSIAPRLPGYTPESPFFFTVDRRASVEQGGVDEPLPPHLSFSIETTGILVFGVLPRSDWESWRAAFERWTGHIPMRRW